MAKRLRIFTTCAALAACSTCFAQAQDAISRVKEWTLQALVNKAPPTTSEFTVPQRTMREFTSSPRSSARVRFTGVVTYAAKSGSYSVLAVEEGGATVWIHGRTTAGLVLPQKGDRLDVEGTESEERRPQSPMVADAVWQSIGHESLAAAPLVPMAEAFSTAFDGRRVRIRGRVVNYQTTADRGIKVSRVWIRSGDLLACGNFPCDEFVPQPAGLAEGRLVELDGVCNVGPVAPGVVRSISVELSSMADARPLPEPPPWEDPATRRYILFTATLLAAAGVWVFLLRRQVRSRTAQLAAREAELSVALAKEQELGQLKTAFVAMVSHEFRTPLNIITGSTDILSRYIDRLPESERAEHLGSIQKSVKRMAAMMEDVLMLGRFEAGQQKFQPQEIHLAAWCRRLVDEMHSSTGGRCAIELTMGDFDPLVRADESILRHILANLLSNAVKYSPEGSVVKMSVTREADEVVFRIADSGIGIPAADRARLFEAFQRGGNVGHVSGTGLGLVVVKRGAELHGGRVTFTSEENKGSTFTITLPVFTPLA